MLVDIWHNEKRLYGNLIDDGSNVMTFASGWGFITRDQVQAKGWTIKRRRQ
jgi:hypothetical protein